MADIILRVDEAPLVHEIKYRTGDVQHGVGVASPSEKQRLGDDAGVDGALTKLLWKKFLWKKTLCLCTFSNYISGNRTR